MTDMNKLAVSLTKHGAHKIAHLLEIYELDDLLAKTWGVVEGVNIDAAQAKKTLSVSRDGKVPAVWSKAQAIGADAINALVLFGIIFSHHRLINLFSEKTLGPGRGVINRDCGLDTKSFTNLKNNFIELGFSRYANEDEFSFDFRSALTNDNTGPLAAELIRLKLITAGWNKKNDLVDECLILELNKTLGLTEEEFRNWLSHSLSLKEKEAVGIPDDDSEKTTPFKFKAQHSPKKTGKSERKERIKKVLASLLHNEIQNALYEYMCNVYGSENVGTETFTGSGDTCIDLVLHDKGNFTFYEIKTATSLKTCIREGLPQLLEYAYWPNNDRACELVIVSPNAPTEDARKYLNKLRNEFGLPIFHETVAMDTGRLSNRI